MGEGAGRGEAGVGEGDGEGVGKRGVGDVEREREAFVPETAGFPGIVGAGGAIAMSETTESFSGTTSSRELSPSRSLQAFKVHVPEGT